MKHIQFLRRALVLILALALLLAVPTAAAADIETNYPAPASAEKIVYGKSGEGRELCAYRFGSGQNVLVLTFAAHGFEDAFDRDGECLVYAAQTVMEQLAAQSERLLRQDWRVYVLPCLNPDGLNSGTSKNGAGRCTTTFYDVDGKLSAAHGVDLDRCFPTDWAQTLTNRNYTGSKPLACAEAAALAEFIENVQGKGENLLLDVHGWEQSTATFDGEDELLAQTLAEFFPGNTYTCAPDAPGGFANHAYALGYESCKFSFPMGVTSLNAFKTSGYAERLASAVSSVIGSTKTVCETGTHNFAQIVNLPARCETDGTRTMECTFCGKTEKTVTPALGHLSTAKEKTVTKTATATRDGEASLLCERCGAAFETEILPAVFKDTNPDEFYADALDVCYAAKIVNGMEKDKFYPDFELSRAMLVTMLYNTEGKPKVAKAADFSDVPVAQYYFEPVSWAQENGIVDGYEDGTFAPDRSITRQETATILYRYIKLKLGDAGAGGDLSAFTDAQRVQPYAREAVGWCVSREIIRGMTPDTIGPELTATRAQTITLIYRVLQYMEQQKI